jgi:MscS family membrane protein
MDFIKNIFTEYFWSFEILFIALALLLITFILRKIVSGLQKRLIRKENLWGKHLKHVFYYPLQLLVWVIGLTVIFLLIGRNFSIEFLNIYIPTLRSIAIVLVIALFLMRFIRKGKKVLLNQKTHRLDSISLDLLSKLAILSVFFLSLLIVLQISGLNILPLLTFGGIGAAVLGFASKDVISNFFGGLMLYATRPFYKGDLVDIPSQNIQGHVEEVGWYMTCIRDLHKKPIYVPNSLFSSGIIVNQSRMTHRRIEEKLGVAYKDFSKLMFILRDIHALLKNDPEIDQTHTPYVYFTSFAPYSLEVYIKAYTLSTREEDFFQTRQNILLQIGKIIEKHDAELPYPTSKIEIVQSKA